MGNPEGWKVVEGFLGRRETGKTGRAGSSADDSGDDVYGIRNETEADIGVCSYA